MIGIDLRDFLHKRPRPLSSKEWWSKYNGLWTEYIDELQHHFLGIFIIDLGHDQMTLGFGCRVEYYFNNYPDISFNKFKGMVAREISKAMLTPVKVDDINYHSVSYIMEIGTDENTEKD